MTLWVVLAAGVMALLVAAMSIKNRKACKGIDIKISGVKEYYFLNKQDVVQIITDGRISSLQGKAIAGFDLQRLETLLERNVWVKDAELFFDNNLVFHVNILEREPVARIITKNGYSFYIDSSGYRMPLSKKMSVRLPVFTGFPADIARPKSTDSSLMEDIKNVSQHILKNEFWMAQIAQVEIGDDKNFEMIPTVGNHIIRFGNGENYKNKFKRLFSFYKLVVSKTGFDKYSCINLQYDKQVVGTKKGIITKIDSVQALKNIQEMIRETMKAADDSLFTSVEKNISGVINAEPTLTSIEEDDKLSAAEKNIWRNIDTAGQLSKKSVPTKITLKKTEADSVKVIPKALMGKIK